MTTEVQTFIELGDLQGMRFECGACHEQTLVRLASQSKVVDYEQGFKCPHCHALWFQGNQDTRLNVIAKFIGVFRELLKTKMPFGLTLQIAVPGPASDRASGSKA
jgi:hypothetical protein